MYEVQSNLSETLINMSIRLINGKYTYILIQDSCRLSCVRGGIVTNVFLVMSSGVFEKTSNLIIMC